MSRKTQNAQARELELTIAAFFLSSWARVRVRCSAPSMAEILEA
jgi:hypothetical protein